MTTDHAGRLSRRTRTIAAAIALGFVVLALVYARRALGAAGVSVAGGIAAAPPIPLLATVEALAALACAVAAVTFLATRTPRPVRPSSARRRVVAEVVQVMGVAVALVLAVQVSPLREGLDDAPLRAERARLDTAIAARIAALPQGTTDDSLIALTVRKRDFTLAHPVIAEMPAQDAPVDAGTVMRRLLVAVAVVAVLRRLVTPSRSSPPTPGPA